jgi:hypothetical protein
VFELRRRATAPLAVAAAVTVSIALMQVGPLSSGETALAAATLGAGGEYHPVTPARVFDSRSGATPSTAPEGRELTVPVVGLGGVPAASSEVLAVAVSITVVQPTAAGYLSVRGAGEPDRGGSVVNFTAGRDVPNSAIVRPGAGGALTLRLVTPGAVGSAHVLVDVFGWFSTSSHGTRGARLVPVEPFRVADTRQGRGPVAAGTSLAVPVRGAGSVPDSGDVVGVVVNLTGVNTPAGNRSTYLSALPAAPAAPPATSNLNLTAGEVKPVLAIVPVGSDGAIHIYNAAGSTDVLVDVSGYLLAGVDESSRAGRVVPLSSPVRLIDTRLPASGDAPLSASGRRDFSFGAFVADVALAGEAIGAQSAVIGNLTATGLRGDPTSSGASTYLSVYPSPVGADRPPQVSSVNLTAGLDVPNLALLRYGGPADDPHRVRFFNAFGQLDHLFDASAVVLAD